MRNSLIRIKCGLERKPASTIVDLGCTTIVIREVKSVSIRRKYAPPRSWFKKYDVELSFSYIDRDGDAKFHTLLYAGYCPLLYTHRDLLKSLMKT